jgi:glycosyltransferase involved in cell wall biosynthesis
VEEGVHGYLVPTRDASAIAEKVILLLKDSGLARTCGQAARRHVASHFTLAHMLTRYQRLYEDATGQIGLA